MDGDYFTVMGLISALNDLAVMSEQSQLIVHQGSTLFTNIIYNSFDCWQSSANTSQASFISGGNLHSCSMLSHPCGRHPCGTPEQTQVGRDALALGPLQKLPVPGLLGFLGIESFPLSSPQPPPSPLHGVFNNPGRLESRSLSSRENKRHTTSLVEFVQLG